MRNLDRIAVVFALAVFGAPALACSVCDTTIELMPNHLVCLKDRIDAKVVEAEEKDPLFVDFAECENEGRPLVDFEGKGESTPEIPLVPEPGGPQETAPETYKGYAFLSHTQLICLKTKIEPMSERPETITSINLEDC